MLWHIHLTEYIQCLQSCKQIVSRYLKQIRLIDFKIVFKTPLICITEIGSNRKQISTQKRDSSWLYVFFSVSHCGFIPSNYTEFRKKAGRLINDLGPQTKIKWVKQASDSNHSVYLTSYGPSCYRNLVTKWSFRLSSLSNQQLRCNSQVSPFLGLITTEICKMNCKSCLTWI